MLPLVPGAIEKSLAISATHRALFGDARGGKHRMDPKDIARVIEIFEDTGARWALVGAHAVGLLTEPRATADFDFLIEDRRLKSVLRGLETAFGELDVEDLGAATRLRAIDVDLIRATNHPLFREALDLAQKSGAWSVPPPEALLALKFLAAVSPWRKAVKRAQDMVDFRAIYEAIGREGLDFALIRRLAGLAYPGAEREIDSILDRIERGQRIEV